jgi:glycosyltransferase 2 family protein
VKKGRSAVQLIWRLTVCCVLLAWIFFKIFDQEGQLALKAQLGPVGQLTFWERWHAAWQYGPPELWKTLNLVDPLALIISLGFMGLTILIGMWRWRLVLRVQGLELSTMRALEISLIAHFFNSFLLGSSGGDLLKAYYAARETHHQKPEAVLTVVVDRIIGLFAMLVFACLMMLPNLAMLEKYKRLMAISGFIALMLAGCGGFLVLAFWGGLSRYWPHARARLRKLPKAELLERALASARRFGQDRVFLLKSMGLSMLLNLACVGQFVALAHGLNLRVPLSFLFLVVPTIICISALPITPSGLGVRENLYVWLLAIPEIAIPATPALSLSLLAFGGSLVWSIVGGGVYLFLRDRQHLDEVTRSDAITEGGWTETT